MRINYYRFPEGTNEKTLLDNGCGVVLDEGYVIYPDSIPDDKRHLVKRIDHTVSGITVTKAKQLLKQYGGCAWTEHCERGGGVFETTKIVLKGNNSKFKYNHHL